MLCRIRTLVCSRLRAPCCSRQASTLKDATDRLESKWQTQWRREAASAQVDNKLSTPDDKFYVLSMFPYPSGRLHMGHVRVYTISDTLAHFYRMRGKKVLHPMGWDAFGLPAENAAIERNTNPSDWTQDNVSNMRSQLLSLGCHFDWHREVSTCSPEYYRWTQWLFLQLYNHGLAYKKKAMVNWDPVDQTVLANEQVDENGCSWRSGAKVEQRYLDQWFFKITDYAEPLLQGLEELDWPNKVKLMQADWIGKSEGAFFDFRLQGIDVPPLRVFTTRPDTIYGVTFMALSPEHDLLQNTQLFDEAVLQAVRELQRDAQEPGTQQDKSKEGICLDVSVVHPFTGASIPLYVADYVVSDYGTKAIMGVPAHDERDYEFAMEHHLPVAMVIESEEGGGILIHSEQFSGLSAEEGGRAIVEHACSQGFGGHMTQYKLRDWLISRQRYWGAPIPIMYCDKCGIVPVPEDQLPVLLPLDIQFTGRGPSPLTQTKEWLNTTCGKPNCSARRETDTMDTFVDSSWYFLRYINPHDNERPFTSDANQWMPVDLYIGGIEHAILHLLYARFVTHFLHNIGAISVREPFNKLLTQGMVQGRTYRLKESGQYLRPEERAGVMDEGGPNVEVSWEKMSKSKHNGVDPQDIIREYGADTVRLFMLFKAPPEAAIQWDIRTIQGVHKWLHRLSVLCQKHVEACTRSSSLSAECDPTMAEQRRKIVSATHRAIRQVTVAFEEKYTFNVAVSELMILSNHLRDSAAVMCTAEYHRALSTLFTMLAPMAPHIACQLWEDLKETSSTLNLETPKGSVLEQRWPTWNQDLIQEENAEVVLQVNGRKKGVISLPVDLIMEHEDLEMEARRRAKEMGIISSDSLVKKVFVAPSGKVVNFVIK